jgi:hypothetical protein
MTRRAPERMHARLAYELDVITQAGLANYFLVVWDWCATPTPTAFAASDATRRQIRSSRSSERVCMVIIRKLTEQEVQTLERKGTGQRKLVEEQYDAFLADYEVGDYGEAELEEDEKRLTVRNRFKKAAARRGIALAFQHTRGNVLRFKVAPLLAAAAEVAFEASAVPPPVEVEQPVASDAPKRRGGRRKAAVAPAG